MTPSTAPTDWQEADPTGQRLVDYLRALRRRWKLVAGVVAAVTATALVVSLNSTKQYDATAKLLLSQSDQINQILTGQPGNSSNDPERDINTGVELIKLETVADSVRRQLHLGLSTTQVLNEITTKVEGNSNVVTLTARDPSPRRGAAIANAFASQYVSFRRDSARASLDEAARLAQSELNSLSQTDRAGLRGRELESRLQELQTAATLQTGGVEVVRQASVPSSPSRPRPLLSGMLGLVLGFILGAAAALLFEFADRRLKDEDAVEEVYGLPILSAIPRVARRGAGRVPGDDHNQREAYGMLAANLRFSALGEDVSALLVTSPGPEEGKTSVTLGLARALAMLGQRVIALEADLRRPAFARYLEIDPERPGITAVISGETTLSEALVWLDAGSAGRVTMDGVREGVTFAVLPVGRLPQNPQRVLSRPTMGALMRDAREMADVVLVDTAPVGTVNDAVTLVNHVDGALIVSRLNSTTRERARRTLTLLRNFDLELPGVVITDADVPPDAYYYGDGASPAEREAQPGGVTAP